MKITICGSMAFYPEMESLRDELSNTHEVLIPELTREAPETFGGGKKIYFGEYIEKNGGIDTFAQEHEIWNLKQDAIVDHFEKIKGGDAILVANYPKNKIEGYIGGNTLIEMGVAFFLNKPIYILHPVSSKLSYKVEILGMKPVILNGDVKDLNLG
jgi:hypothetical protein